MFHFSWVIFHLKRNIRNILLRVQCTDFHLSSETLLHQRENNSFSFLCSFMDYVHGMTDITTQILCRGILCLECVSVDSHPGRGNKSLNKVGLTSPFIRKVCSDQNWINLSGESWNIQLPLFKLCVVKCAKIQLNKAQFIWCHLRLNKLNCILIKYSPIKSN